MRVLLVVCYCLLVLSLQPTIQPNDYPDAISFGCRAMLRGESPYSVVCSSGSPISPGPGCLLVFLCSGLFLAPGLVPLLGIGITASMARPEERDATIAIVGLLAFRASVFGMDYLFAGGCLCWLLLRSD